MERARQTPRRGGQIAYADRADIMDLLARYATYWEFRACRAWAGLFTEDGRFFDVQGRVGLEAACGAPRDRSGEGRDAIHAQTNTLLVQVADDRIHGLTNVVFGSHRAGEANSARFAGYGDYHDVFVRTPQGWRFASRLLAPRGSAAARVPVSAQTSADSRPRAANSARSRARPASSSGA